MINTYYANINWNFSDWREVNFRAVIDEWEDFLRDKHQINYWNTSHVVDIQRLIKNNRDIQMEMEELVVDAAFRSDFANQTRLEALELIEAIEKKIEKMWPV